MATKASNFLKKLSPYNIQKGLRYLKHFGVKEFFVRLSDRLEPEEVPYGPWFAGRINLPIRSRSASQFRSIGHRSAICVR